MRALLLLACAATTPVAAQSLREFSGTRQYKGEPRLAASIDFAAGSLRLEPAPPATLYALRATYDDKQGEAPVPTLAYDRSGSVRMALAARAATVQLSPRTDLDLALTLDAAEADLALGGLRLGSLALTAGASRTTLRVATPNPVRCSTATLESGAAELEVIGLGNARCNRTTVRGGAGRVTLDFSGRWSGDLEVTAAMKMGGLVLRIPRGTGVRLVLDRFLAKVDAEGLAPDAERQVWTSPRFEAAPHRLRIAVESAVGGLRVEWID
ncbi:MAG: hypothetical protein MUC69_06860 [Gemmatimonadales bacterium]|nr:hypothetical protein [Gemmatimonadales bacterium]